MLSVTCMHVKCTTWCSSVLFYTVNKCNYCRLGETFMRLWVISTVGTDKVSLSPDEFCILNPNFNKGFAKNV